MTTLRLYNTLSRTKEDFVPLDPANVRMYVCGPTVYDYAHIGNARPAIVFDVLFRLLRHIYGAGHVTYVRNITDIDDKINARAMERRGDRNVPILDVLRELTEQTYGVYREDVAALGCLEPTSMPRATQYVAQMIAMTRALIDLGYAYAAEGHVLFRVKKKADYGKLARRSLDDMIAGARVDVAPYKEDPMDFVLWKPSDDQTPGWDSPWGRGRPGWHLECSAMIEATMGETIDIHGGGIDLVFPHHENEIAQSEGAHHGHPLARYWMHNGFLNVEGEKMSKSLGNFVTINELLETEKFGGRSWSGEALRLAMLRTHYRQPIDWKLRSLEEVDRIIYRWFTKADEVAQNVISSSRARKFRIDERVRNALLDDLNTPLAISEIHRIESLMDDARDRDEEQFWKHSEHFVTSLHLLGLFDISEQVEKHRREQRELERRFRAQQIEAQIEQRNAARKAKNFAESDRIRDELLTQGIVLKDGPDGTTWEVKR